MYQSAFQVQTREQIDTVWFADQEADVKHGLGSITAKEDALPTEEESSIMYHHFNGWAGEPIWNGDVKGEFALIVVEIDQEEN